VAKTVHPRPRYHDSQIVQDGLAGLLESNPELKAAICNVTVGEAKRLLRSEESAVELAARLKKEGLASPSRVTNYLDMAVRVLMPKYVDERLIAEREAEDAAEVRQKIKVKVACDIAVKHQKVRQRPSNAQFLRDRMWDTKPLAS